MNVVKQSISIPGKRAACAVHRRRMRGASANSVLSSQSGASLLYGLMFLFVATMVAALVLNAATTALERTHSDQKHQQSSLTLTSGANLVRDCLEQTRFKVTTITDKSTGTRVASVELVEGSAELADVLEASMKIAAGEDPLYPGATDATGRSFTLTVQAPGASALNNSKVTVDYSIAKKEYSVSSEEEDTSYRIRASLKLDSSDELLFLDARCAGARAPETSSTSTTTTEVEEVYWDDVSISTQGGN